MAKRRVQFELFVSTAANGTTVQTAVDGDLATKDVFDRPQVLSVNPTEDGTRFVLTGQVRFNVVADADAILAVIEATWTAGPLASLILAGSRVSVHTCPHDDPADAHYDCQGAAARYVEAVK